MEYFTSVEYVHKDIVILWPYIPSPLSLISEDFGVGFLIKVNYQRLICSGKCYRLDTTRSESLMPLTSCKAYISSKDILKKSIYLG